MLRHVRIADQQKAEKQGTLQKEKG